MDRKGIRHLVDTCRAIWSMLEKHSPFLGLLLWVKSGPTPAKASTRYACTVTNNATGEVRYTGSVIADNPANAEILAAMAADLDSFDLPHYTIEVVEAQ